MKTIDEIQKRIDELKSDERFNYPPASVQINAPLALIQLSMTTEVHTLEWVLEKLK